MTPLKLSVFITANGKDDLENIKLQLREVNKLLGLKEIFLLSDCNKEIQRFAKQKRIRVLKLGTEIMNHEKRAIGAKLARGRVILFLDTSFVIRASILESIVSNIQRKKADLAISTLNSTPQTGVFNFETVEYMLHMIANRRELVCASMYHAPFAISREAVKKIGIDNLAIPPLAKLIAIQKGLKIEVFHNIAKKNIDIDHNLLLEECIQSLIFWYQNYDKRSNYTNLGRRLDILKVQKDKVQPFHQGVTAIISASNEEGTIGHLIKNALNAGVSQVVVIENGSTDFTAKYSKEAGAKVLSFPYRIGHDVGRAIGAICYPSSSYLFLDGDMIISTEDLKPFITAITKKNGVDVALNDLSSFLKGAVTWDDVTWSKYFLNQVLNRKDLDVNTLTAVPNAINGKALEMIGPENLAIPTVAMVRAVLAGLNVQAVKKVDVISKNKIRNEYHLTDKGDLTAQLIIGDMCEGLYELIHFKHGKA